MRRRRGGSTVLTKTTATTPRDRWFVGTLFRVLADRADTDGQLAVMEQRAPRGFSPPLHVHRREDTALLVLDGELRVRVGDDERTLGVGDFAWLPRDVPHSFRVESEEAHLLELATPAGVEAFHVEASDPAPSFALPPPGAPDVARLLAAGERHGAEIVGPPMAPPPS
jgi:quercetin dioxygenase-like cupin family protein